MSRRGENIYKRKDGRWEGRYIKGRTIEGKTMYGYVYGRSYVDVKKLVDTEKKIYEKRQKNAENIIFRDIAEQWFSYRCASTKPSTAVKYRNILDKHLLPKFGETSMFEITASEVETFSLQKLENGRLDGKGGLSAKTINDMLSVLREIFYYAEKRYSCVLCRIGEIHIKMPERKLQVISREEQERLEQYLLTNESLRNTGILMSLYMGLRIGELCALKWQDILLDKGVVRIRHTMQRLQNFDEDAAFRTEVLITAPKSACAIRDIPIPLFLLELLQDHNHYREEDFFLTGSPKVFMEPRAFQYYFKKVLAVNEMKEINFHVLRHTFATRCIEMGFDLKSLSEILGHSTVNITLNNYIHTSMELKRENMLRMAEPLSCIRTKA